MIVNQWGEPYKFAKGAQRSTSNRPWEPVQMKDISTLIPSWDRKTLVSASRRLYMNEGVLLGAIQQKAMYAVGRSWQAQSQSADKEWQKAAETKINEEWYGICDVRGGMHNFQTSLYALSCAIDRDGEAFVLLTKTGDEYPRIQHIPCHRVQNPNGVADGKLTSGLYKGLKIQDGIIYSKGAPVAYVYCNEDGTLDQYLSARDVIHLFDTSFQEQGRGLPAATHAINDLRDALQSHEWERHAQLMLSSIGLIEHNETGLPDPDDNANVLNGTGDVTCGERGIIQEQYEGGQIRYFAAKSGGKLETIKNDRPGDMWESFQNRIYRKTLAGMNWPYSMVWHATGQGTAERADLGRAQRAVEDRQDVLEYAAKRMVGYAVAVFIKRGDLPPDNQWYRWKFSYPKKLTIDDGRVSKELIEMWKAGFLNPNDILGYLGKSPEDHIDERISYLVMQKTKVATANQSAPDGVRIEDREMAMLTPNEVAQPDGNQPATN